MVRRTRSASRSGSSSSACWRCSRTGRGSAPASPIRRCSTAGRPRSAGSSRTRSSSLLVLAIAGGAWPLLGLRRPTVVLAERALRRRCASSSRSTSFEAVYSARRRPGERAGPHADTLGAGARRGVHRQRDRHLHVGAVRRGADLPRARLLAPRAVRPLARRSSPSASSSGSRTASSLSLPVIVVFGCALAWVRSKTGQRAPRHGRSRALQRDRADRRRHHRQLASRRAPPRPRGNRGARVCAGRARRLRHHDHVAHGQGAADACR